MTPAWIARTNVYEVNLRQYTPEGTIAAFRPHLPRLRDMGVETLWFMPLTPIAQERKKGSLGSYYACSDFTAVSEEFGTLADFRALVEEAHAMGFKVILDWVANHTGWDHRWTREHPGWYERDAAGGLVPAHGMDDIVELDFRQPDLRAAMIEAMRFWITETGIDGFRCDLAFWVELDFWVEARAALANEKPLFWLGELDPLTHPEYMEVFDAAYTWSWMHAAQEFYGGRLPLAELLPLLQRYVDAPGFPAWFTANHDENSWNGTEYEKYGALAPLLAVLGATAPGIPLLYSGQELPNYKRLQFFEKDPIGWGPRARLHSFYKALLEARAQHPALAADAACRLLPVADGAPVLALLREAPADRVLVLLNFSPEAQPCSVPGLAAGRYADLLGGFEREGAPVEWQLGPWGYLLLHLY